eukprot:gene20026-26741_t
MQNLLGGGAGAYGDAGADAGAYLHLGGDGTGADDPQSHVG